eukprot:gene9171-6450_t
MPSTPLRPFLVDVFSQNRLDLFFFALLLLFQNRLAVLAHIICIHSFPLPRPMGDKQGLPPVVSPGAAEARRRKRHTIPFAEMAALNVELARIEQQLEELRGVQDSTSQGAPGDEANLELMDPMVHAMINVELCELAASGATEEMRILLESGADPNTRDYDARSLLHIAAMNGHVGVVETLLAFGADANQMDGHGKSALEYAEARGLMNVVMVLAGHQGGGHTNLNNATSSADADSVPSSSTSQGVPDFSSIPQPMVGSLIVIMVGLPGRGKTYIARQICRYFQWNGLPSTIFADKKEAYKEGTTKDSRKVVELTSKVMKFITQSGGVAIIDGRFEATSNRQAILREILKTERIKMNRVIFVEVICNNPEVIHRNILQARDLSNRENGEEFVEEYYRSIKNCENGYKTLNPISDVDLSYIRIEDNAVYSLNQISGWMPSRLAFMLHNLNHTPTAVYLTRSGEYVDLSSGRIGGNSSLTARGTAYTQALFEFFQKELKPTEFLNVLSSCATRSTQTCAPFSKIALLDEVPRDQESSTEPPPFHCRVVYFPTLDDINHGDCEGMLISEVKQTMPYTIQEMKADPYYTAWPNGECLHQVFNSRLEPHIHDIQASSAPVLVISHLSLLQGLHSYFVSPDGSGSVNPQTAFKIKIPLECVIKIHMVRGERVAEVIDLSQAVNEAQDLRSLMSFFGLLLHTVKLSPPTRSEVDHFSSLSLCEFTQQQQQQQQQNNSCFSSNMLVRSFVQSRVAGAVILPLFFSTFCCA